jgi:hypothetical protein
MSVELVLAIYDRDYNWISGINSDVKITKYNKNENKIKDSEILIKPNIGRDVHTFFYHIVKNYDSLSEYTFFSQDYPFDHVSNYVEIINDYKFACNKFARQNFKNTWFFDTCWDCTLSCNSNGDPHHPGLKIKSVWDEIFLVEIPELIYFTPAGHFCVKKEQIYRYPKKFYEKIKKILEENPQAPWIIERLLPYIFGDQISIKT